jgi:predicted unusual protein kinase regulating ubiquinone biosynthesis (AarF/ABC1/UbiB family)
MADDPEGPTRGWARRTLKTGRIAASLGRKAARQAVKDRLGLGHEDDAEATAAAFERLALEMDQMKGLVLKVGQMASYLDGALPERGQRVLRKLQREAEPMTPEAARRVIQEGLGRPPEALFEAFEEQPAAAASIGQVHRARLDGRPVAVKIQYPGIADTLDTDLGNLRRVGALASVGMATSGREMARELRTRMREETDYLLEGARQEHFRGLLADEGRVVIPQVHPGRCARTVLTMDWLEGEGFYAFRDRAAEALRARAAALLFEISFRSIFAHGAFNGDPHPGNVLFLPDGRVGLLDWGCVRTFDRAFVEGWKGVARVVLAGDRAAFPEAFRRIGFAPDPDRIDWDAQYESIRYLYEPMLAPRFRFTHDYVQRSWDVLLWKNPNLRRIRMPPAWLLIQRVQWGLYSVLALLDAEADFATPFRRWLDTPSIEGHAPSRLRPPDAAARAPTAPDEEGGSSG